MDKLFELTALDSEHQGKTQRRRGTGVRIDTWTMPIDEITERHFERLGDEVGRKGWHLDEVFVRINGEMHFRWRAVDHEGEVLEVFATKRRDRKVALRLRVSNCTVCPLESVNDFGAEASVLAGLNSHKACYARLEPAQMTSYDAWTRGYNKMNSDTSLIQTIRRQIRLQSVPFIGGLHHPYIQT